MNNPHELPQERHAQIIAAVTRMARRCFSSPDTVTLHGSKFPEGAGLWELGEVRAHSANGRVTSVDAEWVYDEEVDEDFSESFDEVAAAVSEDIPAAAWTFDEAEPWLAVLDLQTSPRLVWRVTAVTPISYDEYRELPAGPE